MKLAGIFLLSLVLQSCIPNFLSGKEDKLYVKQINVPPLTLEWFFYSSAFSETQDYITLQKFDKLDTICISDNIADINFKDQKVIIGFYGQPTRYSEKIVIPDTFLGYRIIIDTNFILKEPIARKFYKKEI